MAEKILFIYDSLNQTTMAHKIARHLSNSNTDTIARDLISAFTILAITQSEITLIFIPELIKLFTHATNRKEVEVWLLILITMYLIAFPIFLIVQGYSYYRDARKLAKNTGSTMQDIEQACQNEHY